MKKVLALISAFAICLSLATAQQNGPGGDRDGPRRNMWGAIADAINSNPEVDQALKDALETVNVTRAALAVARAEDPDISVEDFRAAHEAEIAALKGAITTLQTWWRENRPDRPDPVIGERAQVRRQLHQTTQAITETRRQLRAGELTKEQARIRLGNLLQERKHQMRNRRQGEGGSRGEGDPPGGG